MALSEEQKKINNVSYGGNCCLSSAQIELTLMSAKLGGADGGRASIPALLFSTSFDDDIIEEESTMRASPKSQIYDRVKVQSTKLVSNLRHQIPNT